MKDFVLDNYLKEHPDASLKDYQEFLINKQKDEQQKEKDRREAEIQYYKDYYVGKYVLIEHHSAAHTFYGPLPEDICYSNLKPIPSISVYTNEGTHKGGLRVDIDKSYLNLLWLNNPYTQRSSWSDKTIKCKIITQEEFESIRDTIKNTILGINTKIN